MISRKMNRLSKASQQRASRAIALMRKGKSLRQATQAAKTSVLTVQKYAGKKLERSPTGRFVVRQTDRRIRNMKFLASDGLMDIEARGSESATRIAKYWNAVDRYLKTGDMSQLQDFRGKRIQSQGKRYQFITDPKLLERLAYAGEVKFEEIYNLST